MAENEKASRDDVKKLFRETLDEWYTEKEKATEEKKRTESETKKSGGFLDVIFGG